MATRVSIRSSVYQCILLHRPFITVDLPNGDSYTELMWVISNLEGAIVHCSNLIDLQLRQDAMSVWKVERDKTCILEFSNIDLE